jgi:acetyl-CoA carboxylase carboxyl transferase subunit alpha
VIDRIVSEPVGGAHRDPTATAEALAAAIDEELTRLSGKGAKALRRMREDRFLAIGERKTRRERRKVAGT